MESDHSFHHFHPRKFHIKTGYDEDNNYIEEEEEEAESCSGYENQYALSFISKFLKSQIPNR